MGGFINTFCINRPFMDIHDLDMAQNENKFDAPGSNRLRTIMIFISIFRCFIIQRNNPSLKKPILRFSIEEK